MAEGAVRRTSRAYGTLSERHPLTPIHRAALHYAGDFSLLIIPLERREKRPAFKTGPNHETLASRTPHIIDGWWNHKDYNIGLPCTPNRIAVIDVDGPDGETHLAQLEAEHGLLPATWTQSSNRTDRPSVQLIYSWPNGELVPTGRISSQLEVRAHGAQVVLAPSIHPTGTTYTWITPPTHEQPRPPDLPAWVVTLLTRTTTTSQPASILPAAPGDSLATKRFAGLVEHVARAPEGERNQALNHAAYTAARIPGLTDQQITERLTTAAQTAGLEDREITSTIRSGLTAGHRDGPDPDHEEPTNWKILIPRPATTDPDRIEDLDRFLNSPEPEYDWIIEGLLERGDRVILTGTEGAGKTTLLRQIAVTAAAGIHPFTGDPIPPQRVGYIDLENSARHSRRQFKPLRIQAGSQLADDQMFPVIRPDGLDLLDNEDQTWLQNTIETIRPDILIIGPVYKLVGGDPTEEQPAKHAATLLDRLRITYGFALLMEAHSPHETAGRKRPKRPYGASLWLRWPEFGLHIGDQGALTHWRGARDERSWPSLLKRGGEWPWTNSIAPQDVLWQRIVEYCEKQLVRPPQAVIASALEASTSAVSRAVQAHQTEWEALAQGETE